MARTALTPQSIGGTGGLVPTYSTPGAGAGNGFTFPPKPGRFLWIKNGNAAVCTVTMLFNQSKAAVDGQVPADKTATVAASTGERFLGGFTDVYVDPTNNINVDFSVGTSVSVALVDP